MTCPRCSVAQINALTGQCELCGYVAGGVATESHHGSDTTDELARRELAHQFRLDVLQGQGVTSVVYLARDLDAEQRVVLKVLQRSPDSKADERFIRGLEIVSTLDHPHLVPVLRFGKTDSLLWYSMAHASARPLRVILRNSDPMQLKTCMRIANQVASALDHLHRRGIVHGNVKPENVLVDSEYWIRLSDTGTTAALESGPPARVTGHLLRPPAYLAPEDWLNAERSSASDQYALAVLLHECLTHAVPFAAGAERTAPPAMNQWRGDLPAHVEHALHRALSAVPQERFPSVLDFVAAMEMGSAAYMRPSQAVKRATEEVLFVPDDAAGKFNRRWLAVPVAALALFAGWQLIKPKQPRWAEGFTTEWTQPQSAPALATPAPAEAGLPAGAATVRAPEPAPTSPAPTREAPRTATTPPSVTREVPPAGATPQPATRPGARPQTAAPAPAPAPVATAAEPGILFVNATPWGQIYVDGQLIGNTPRPNIRLSPGSHALRIVREGYEPYERTIEIISGQTLRLTAIVLTPIQ